MRTAVCRLDELARCEARRFEIAGHRVCVVRIDDEVYAVGDTCSHADVSLSEGEVSCDDREIVCWKHGSSFSLTTGEPATLPATKPIPVYEAAVVDGQIVVTLS